MQRALQEWAFAPAPPCGKQGAEEEEEEEEHEPRSQSSDGRPAGAQREAPGDVARQASHHASGRPFHRSVLRDLGTLRQGQPHRDGRLAPRLRAHVREQLQHPVVGLEVLAPLRPERVEGGAEQVAQNTPDGHGDWHESVLGQGPEAAGVQQHVECQRRHRPRDGPEVADPQHEAAQPGSGRDLAEERDAPGLLDDGVGPHQHQGEARVDSVPCPQKPQQHRPPLQQLKHAGLRPRGQQANGESHGAVFHQRGAAVVQRRAEQPERVQVAHAAQELLRDKVRQQQHPQRPARGPDVGPRVDHGVHRASLEARVVAEVVRPAQVAAGQVVDAEQDEEWRLLRALDNATHR
mmetsp:Transcript_38469/g.101923  ORF Transcript_38469/g.101923 Transcript_38469/m.101923 type:complete len:349 (-) Transcript_38469:1777-2823(-)